MKTFYLVHHRRNGPLIEAVEREGHYALCSRDAEAALGALRAIRADLFVIEVGNPKAKGERLLERLRDAPEWRDIPVILTGAWAEQWERLAQGVGFGAVMRAGEDGAERVLALARQLLHPSSAPRGDAAGATCRGVLRKRSNESNRNRGAAQLSNGRQKGSAGPRDAAARAGERGAGHAESRRR